MRAFSSSTFDSSGGAVRPILSYRMAVSPTIQNGRAQTTIHSGVSRTMFHEFPCSNESRFSTQFVEKACLPSQWLKNTPAQPVDQFTSINKPFCRDIGGTQAPTKKTMNKLEWKAGSPLIRVHNIGSNFGPCSKDATTQKKTFLQNGRREITCSANLQQTT